MMAALVLSDKGAGMQVTKRQHYVWRHYLSAWGTNGQVYARRAGGNPFKTDPKNLAVESYFYRTPPITEDDEQFIVKFIEKSISSSMLRELAMGWLDTFAMPSRVRRRSAALGLADPELEKLLTEVEIQSEENLHAGIEGDATRFLDELRAGSAALWHQDDDARDFAFFLSLQHLRTKRMQEVTIGNFDPGPMRDIAKNAWPVFRLILATTLGWSLFSDRSSWNLRTLTAGGEVKFITADQPTTNLLSSRSHNDLAFYYPVGPDRAAFLEHKGNVDMFPQGDILEDDIVHQLNTTMFNQSHEQVFGISGDYLAKF